MQCRISVEPQQSAEAAHIVEPQTDATFKINIGMVVLAGELGLLQNPQKATHTQVDQQGTDFGSQQQVFGPPFHPLYRLATDSASQIDRYRPAQPWCANYHLGDLAPFDKRLDATTDGFDFRQFGHQ